VLVAILAALAMVANDIAGTILVMAEAAGRGWLAGAMDTAGWLVSITTTTISVTALQGHSFSEKVLVVAFVSAANLFGTKSGQMIGTRILHHNPEMTLEERVAALEHASRAG
jgi:hypothetical protein